MPEAAEVTVAARQLADVAVGRELTALVVSHPRTSRAQPVETLQCFAGHRVEAVRRHGKWILLSVAGVSEQLGIHLRMSGQLLAVEPETPHPDRHVHAVFSLGPRPPRIPSVAQHPPGQLTEFPDGGAVEVWFRDPRTFGELRLLEDGAPVAPDLFDPAVTGEVLAAAAARCTVGAKAVLLDQGRAVSGVGSYLGDEAFHRAGLAPVTPAHRLAGSAWSRVLDASRDVAIASADAGGVTLADEGWVDLRGRSGCYGGQLRVHARETCGTCGTPTRRAVVGGRSARWCPRCQPARRLR